jgi:hypothetical protein
MLYIPQEADMTEKTKFNMVEFMAGAWGEDEPEEQAFDQPCKYENRVGCHSTYCHNEKLVGQRKCFYRWTSAERHSKCEGYEPNPAYTGQWEKTE